MLRAVLDANVFLSALIRPEGPPGKILARFVEEAAFQLVVSLEIISELRRALGYDRVRRRLSVSDADLDAWVDAIEFLADVVEDLPAVPAVHRDPEDDKYVAAAIEERAAFIVSGDQHLMGLREHEGIRVLSPRSFLGLLEK